jgi:hypothetical protein
MTAENVLAREYDLSIDTGTDAVPVWTLIGGITGITPGQSAARTDDTDFDNNGWDAHSVVSRGRTLSVALNYKEDPADGTQDPGQEALIAASEAMGTSAKKKFKYVSPNGNGVTFTASVDLAWPGGDKTANANFSAELTMSGAPTPVVPA